MDHTEKQGNRSFSQSPEVMTLNCVPTEVLFEVFSHSTFHHLTAEPRFDHVERYQRELEKWRRVCSKDLIPAEYRQFNRSPRTLAVDYRRANPKNCGTND